MIDFTTLTTDELATFAVANQADMDADGITHAEIIERLAEGSAIFAARPFGFALLEQKSSPLDGKMIPHLWLLYVDPTARGKKTGHRFMRELLREFARDYHMSLYCHGPRRRAFFGRLGFRVESRDGEMRRMTTNPN